MERFIAVPSYLIRTLLLKYGTILAAAREAIENGKESSLEYTIANTDRAVGAMLAGAVAKKYGQAGLPEQTIHIKFKPSGRSRVPVRRSAA